MSGGRLIKQTQISRKWGLFDGPYGTGFPAAPGFPDASPWSIMDRADSESRSRDMTGISKIKFVCLGRGVPNNVAAFELWGYHEDGPPDFLGSISWQLGSPSAGVDATFLPADISKFSPEISAPMGDGANWYGADVTGLAPGVYGSDICDLNQGVLAKMNLANTILDISGMGLTHIGSHCLLSSMAAAAMLYIPVN